MAGHTEFHRRSRSTCPLPPGHPPPSPQWREAARMITEAKRTVLYVGGRRDQADAQGAEGTAELDRRPIVTR